MTIQNSISNLPELCTVKQWARAFNVCDMTVYRACSTGELESVKVRNAVRICRDKNLEKLGLKEAAHA